jgi:hypothetical protein
VEVEISGRNPDMIFQDCRGVILDWINKKTGRPLPKHAWEGETFQLEEVGAQFAAAVAIENPKYWAARVDDADKEVPRRSWITEVALAHAPNGNISLGTRLFCVSLDEIAEFVPSIPAFLRGVLSKHEIILDGRPINDDPWLLQTRDDVEEFISFLTSPLRRHDVIVFSLPDGSINKSETVIPLSWIRLRLLGAAHLVIITGPASYYLTDLVGKEFSVFNQAVRTYRRNLNFDHDQPFRHPLAFPERIQNWDSRGAVAFGDLIVANSLRTTLLDRDREARLPPFSEVRQIATKIERDRARKAGAKEGDLLNLALTENEQLRKEIEEQKKTYDGLLAVADDEAQKAIRDSEETHSQNSGLRARLTHLESVLATRGKEEIEIPESFNSLEEWAQKYLAGSVVIHNRALRAVRKSIFLDVPLAYKALLMLRDYYVPMRRDGEGGIEKRRAYEQELQNLGLEDSQTLSSGRYGEEGDTYRVDFDGSPYVLDRHLKGNNSRDERYGFRLYYFWHDERQQVVVGWLPSHLTNRAS